MSSRTFKGLTALAVSTSLLALSAPAFAQLDEIIVTAQKKQENLQDVPVAITAFDLEALETNRIEGLQDIGTFTPGLYVTNNPADPNGVRVSIRGIGTYDPQVGQDSRVAIYQDGIYLGKTQGLGIDMPDLARIEILKGPQGTLYGRNTVAGAINLVSATPNPGELSGKINAEYGNYDHKKVSGAVNLPMGDTAAVRLSGSYMDRSGWIKNSGPGADFGGEKKYGMRGAFGVEFSDAFRLDLAADYNKTEAEPIFYQSVTDFGAGLFAPAISTSDGRQEEVTTSFTNEAGNLVTQGVSAIGTWSPAENHVVKLTAAYREVESSRFVALIPSANPAVVNAITGGFNQALGALPFAFGATQQPLRPDFGSQFDGSVPDRGLFLSPPGGSANLPDHNQFSLEATYTGETNDGKLEYTAGAFFFDEETGSPVTQNLANANDYLFVLGQFDPRVTAPNITGFLGGLGVPAAAMGPIPAAGVLLSFLQGPLAAQAFPLLTQLVGNGTTCTSAPSAANNFCLPTLSVALNSTMQTTTNSLQIDTTALALYAQGTYHVSDDFRITAGLRYSDESKDGVGQMQSAFFNDNVTLTGNVIAPNEASFDDDVLDPSVTLEWDANDDVMIYASYKESFRSGGFNASSAGFRMPGQTYSADFTFQREDITAYEGGFKGDFGDNVRINAAAYYYDFANKQVTFATNPLIATERAIVNTDDEVYGFEVDGTFVLNDNFTARGSYAYIDGTAGDTVNPLNPADVRSYPELQGTPKNSYMMAIDYNGKLGNKDLFGNLTFSHKDDILAIPESALRLPAIDLVSGRIGMSFDTSNGAKATIALWGTNLLDEEYLVDSLPFETFAYRTNVYGQPRSYGITAGLTF